MNLIDRVKRISLLFVLLLGFIVLHGEELLVVPTIKQLPLVGVNAMIQDQEGYVWYATTEGGLCRDNGYQVDVFRNDRNNTLRLGHSNGVLSLCETGSGDICFGTRENLYLLRKKDYSIIPIDTTITKAKVRLIRKTTEEEIVAIVGKEVRTYDSLYQLISCLPLQLTDEQVEDSSRILYGSFRDLYGRWWRLIDGTPYITLPKNALWQRTTERVNYNSPPKVCTSNCGHVFVGDEQGISIYSGNRQLLTRIDSLSNIRQLIPAPQGGAYFISAHANLAYCSDSGLVTVLQSGNESKALACTIDGTIWTAGWQGQIWRWDRCQRQPILDEQASMQSNDPVNDMIVDGQGILWILTDREVKAFNPRSRKSRIISNDNPSVNIQQFQHLRYNGVDVLVFGSDGTLCIHAQDFCSTPWERPLKLTSIAIDGQTKPVPPDMNSFDVDPDVTNVTLYFSTFDPLNACDIRMSYSIDHGKWIDLPRGENSLQLTSLTQGTYNVEVRATNPLGWDIATTNVTICRLPAWYETRFAYLIYLLLFIGLVIVGDRLYVRYRNAHRRVNELQRRIEELLQDRNVKIESMPDEMAENEEVHEFMDKAIAAVMEHLSDQDYDVTLFASDLCMSRATLYRMFADTTGQKPLEFIRTIRLKRAEELLRTQPDLTVQAVAAMTGFASISNFIKRFHEMFGVNPSQIAPK